MDMAAILIIIAICLLPTLYGMLERTDDDFTESDPACDSMIPNYNRNIISPLEQTTFKIRIFDNNDRETFEYDAENKKVLRGFRFSFFLVHVDNIFFNFLFYVIKVFFREMMKCLLFNSSRGKILTVYLSYFLSFRLLVV